MLDKIEKSLILGQIQISNAMKIRNIWTLETQEVANVFNTGGQIIYRISSRPGAQPGARFFEEHPQFTAGATNADGWRILYLDSSWEIITGKDGGKAEEIQENPTHTPARVKDIPQQDDDAQQLVAILSRMKGGNIDESRVVELIRNELEKQDTRKVEYVTPWSSNIVEGCKIADFDEICAWVMQGEPVYMYGPAGCGKSHTAAQIAQALDLDFYESMQLNFAHEVKGYGDAGGNYVETPFYKAFKNGGIFFFDEMDRSAAEALTTLNTAIANKRFDFPVVGNVQAHPNFRVIAAGNTLMDGASDEYVAGMQQDGSVKDRFVFWAVDYEKQLEKQLANGDDSIVDFCHDLRQAAKAAGLKLTVSYRAIKTMANPNLNGNKARVVEAAILKNYGKDEARILYGQLTDKANTWAKALKEIADR